jgi:aryl-alcohol dehydrogenase-like predicted oxidoreductase
MNLRKLGQSDLNITPIGIGAWAIGGGKWEFAWGAQDDAESVVAIHAGLERGINWIDTAAVYGLGHSEEVVGRAVRGLNKRPYVFTKCSLVWDESGTISHNLKGGSLAWQMYDSSGQATASKGRHPAIPAWSFAAVMARGDNAFSIPC